jgi:hypothetical protein
MFFLIRTAFWLSIVVMLLPTPESVKTETSVGAAQAVTAASATFSDMSQFCTRQPGACEVGSQALVQFGHKAQASAKWLYEKFASSKAAPSETGSSSVNVVGEVDHSQNTLTQADAMPAWRGQPQRQADARRAQ